MEDIKTGKLTIVNEAGKEVAVLTASSDGVGLWLNGPDGKKVIAIYAIEGQTAIGIYDEPGKKPGIDIALGVNDGGPFIQVTKGDKVVHLGVDALVALAEHVK